jgi:succinate dehydrogenase cytochrome b556 subunit
MRNGTLGLHAVPSRGFLSWLLQRITGLVLVICLLAHALAVHVLRQGPLDSQSVQARFAGALPAKVLYGVFILTVVFHAFNGVWGVLLDAGPSAGARRAWLALLWIAGIAVAVWAFQVLQALAAI